MKVHKQNEQLQEILLELKRSKDREKYLQRENQAILNGLSNISDAQTKEDIFSKLLNTIEEFIPFENAIVLTSSIHNENYYVLASTKPEFYSLSWKNNSFFERVCNNESLVLFKPFDNSEFNTLSDQIKPYFSSLSITGIKGHSGNSIIILMHSKFGVYSPKTKVSMKRFVPLIERAIIDIEYKERLHSLVNVKTKELNISRGRFKDFAETVGDWFWETDTDFNFTYLSDSLINDMPIEANNLYDLINTPSVNTLIKKAKENIRSFNELEWHSNNIHCFTWMSISGKPFFNRLGHLVGYRGTAKDITKRKEQLKCIQDSQIEAEKANKAKSQFLAMMSHEIRTPLNATLGMIDVFKDSDISSEQKEWLVLMENSAQLLLTIISDVLDISRIESGTFTLNEETIDIYDTIESSTSYFKGIADKKGIILIVTVSQNVPRFIKADPARVVQILFNLIGNAIKFTNNGSVRINIEQVECEKLTFTISDTGIGISKSALKHLFKPFTQADSSITRQFGGTGLGLSITKRLVELMHGDIQVESTLYKGSVFTVTLPLCKVSSSRLIKKEQYLPLIRSEPLDILIAEDNKANQVILQLILEKQGHKVTLVNNGERAVEMLNERNPYDVILMDVSMPIKDGITATKELRALGISTPIIAITAHAMSSEKEQCLNAGMNGFLSKPIRSNELKRILNKFTFVLS